MNELILRDSDILNPEFGFNEKMAVAISVASSLKKVIKDQKLAVTISGNEYVTAEGWSILGTMLGCSPYVVEVSEVPTNKNGNICYRAIVEIRQGNSVLSRAEAIAERNGRQKDRFAIYSMAQTRALGKAYRLCLSWIVKLAGYEATPAEEMPKFTVRDLQNRKEQKQYEDTKPVNTKSASKIPDDYVEIVEPTPKQQHNLNELHIEDPEPLQTLYNNCVQSLEKEGMEISKSNLRVKATGMKRVGLINDAKHQELIDFINSNEELD